MVFLSGENEPPTSADRRAEFTVTARDDKHRGWRTAEAVAVALAFVATLVALPATLHVSGLRESPGTMAGRSWDVVGFSAAIGLASAAILQIGKQIFGLRSLWQRRWVQSWVHDRCAVPELWRSWLQERPYLLAGETAEDDPTAHAAAEWPDENFVTAFTDKQGMAAFDQLQAALLGSYARRDLRLVFDLPAEQLCALLSTAADHALLNPPENAELLLAFSGPAGLSDIDQVAPPRAVADYRIGRGAGDIDDNGDAAALGRLARSVRSGLDVLQASIGQQWSRAVRTWAVALSGALGLAVVMFIRLSPLQRVLFALAALLLGGFFAWLIRDLTAVIERARR